MKTPQQRLLLNRLLKKAGVRHQALPKAYRGIVESIITVRSGDTTLAERKSLQQFIKTAKRIFDSDLPSMDTLQVS